MIRLGFNLDHVATVRNARGEAHPDPLRAAQIAMESNVVDGITAHLREDRRHIGDEDIGRLKKEISLPLNLEMAATQEMLEIALSVQPHACCIVPERREELTTEGGLDVVSMQEELALFVKKLVDAGIRVSLFVDPDKAQLGAAKAAGAPVVELHTGAYANAQNKGEHLQRLSEAATYAAEIGLECHAGHGLNFNNVKPVAALPEIVELNIGHFLVGEAIFMGLEKALTKMRQLMNEAHK